MMVLFKSMLNATTKYSMQFTNGYSGIQPVDNLLISFFNILMTNWFVLFWSIYDQDVSFSKYGTTNKDGSSEEEKLPFKLSEYYAYCREFMNRQRFVKMIILTDIYSVVCGFIIFFVYYYGEGVLGAEGEVFGLYTYGVFSVASAVIVHHLQVLINVRNFTPWLTFWFCFSICMLPLVLKISDSMPKSNVRGSTFAHILNSPFILLMMLLVISVCAIPLYFNKKVR